MHNRGLRQGVRCLALVPHRSMQGANLTAFCSSLSSDVCTA